MSSSGAIKIRDKKRPTDGTIGLLINKRQKVNAPGRGLKDYDVFISHRGPDVKRSFVGHLYESLKCKGLRTFLDAKVFEGGERVWETIEDAIHSSSVCIIVFTADYASSFWCMDELQHILANNSGKLVLPVFYGVQPGHLRRTDQEQSLLNDAIRRKFKERGFSSEKISSWSSNLRHASDFYGHKFKPEEMFEADFVNEIVTRVLRVLNPKILHVVDNPVGLQERASQVLLILENKERKLQIASAGKRYADQENGVVVIGILGMGGAGKSTIAREVFNQIQHRFDATCYLEGTRWRAKLLDGLPALHQRLLEDLCNDKEIKVKSKFHGEQLLRERLNSKRSLVVLDDVDTPIRSITELIPITGLGYGSVIIVTSCDDRILSLDEVTLVYRVPLLSSTEAAELLQRHAFRNTSPSPELMVLAKEVTNACGGLPLALEVIGGELFGRNLAYWGDIVERLHDRKLLSVTTPLFELLRSNYDTLDEQEKRMFLDIACLLHGEPVEVAIGTWEGSRMSAKKGLQILIDRCLVKLTHDGTQYYLTMHDILRDFACSLLVKESEAQPNKQSRWLMPDSEEIFLYREATGAVEGLSLIGCTKKLPQDQLSSLRNLRILMLDDMVWEPCVNFPRRLTLMKWHKLSIPRLPKDFLQFPHLVILDLSYSTLKYLWDDNTRIELPSLQELNLSHCEELITLPMTIKELTRLLKLSLYDSLNRVRTASLEGQECSLHRPRHQYELPSHLEVLLLGRSYFVTIPSYMSFPRWLKILDIQHSYHLLKLPEVLIKLSRLEILNLRSCTSLEFLPGGIGELKSLVALDLRRCSALKTLPDSIVGLRQLQRLLLRECALRNLPKEIGSLQALIELDVEDCTELLAIPLSVCTLQRLEFLSLRGCTKIEEISDSICFFRRSARRHMGLAECLELHASDYFHNLLQLEVMMDKRSFDMKLLRVLHNTKGRDSYSIHVWQSTDRRLKARRNVSHKKDVYGYRLDFFGADHNICSCRPRMTAETFSWAFGGSSIFELLLILESNYWCHSGRVEGVEIIESSSKNAGSEIQ